MSIQKTPFRRYSLEQRKDGYAVVAIRLNQDEQAALLDNMRFLEQPKASTAIKQLLELANIVLHGSPEGKTAKLILHNIRKNQRTGIVDAEQEIGQTFANVNQDQRGRHG